MNPSEPPTPERVREVLRYTKSTGVFTWLVTRSHAVAGSRAGTITTQGYRQIGLDGGSYRASNLAWLYVTGSWPKHEIDHKDRDQSNDRWKNLRAATRKQNCENNGLRKDSSTGVRGVHLFKRTGRWTAYINHNGKRYHLGYFIKKADAQKERMKAEREFYTHSSFSRENENRPR